jgi:hypothetical protein
MPKIKIGIYSTFNHVNFWKEKNLFLLGSKCLTKSIEQFIKSENQVFKLWIYETLKLFHVYLYF